MKLLNFKKNNQICLGLKTNKGIISVNETAQKNELLTPKSISGVISGGKKALEQLNELEGIASEYLEESEIEFAPCVEKPEKIICVGLNYQEHQAEVDLETVREPVIFSKFNNSLASHKEAILIPKNVKQMDFEAELVIVIGKQAKNITIDSAEDYIFGYTIGNDLSARDWQFLTSQWLVGKSLDAFAPIGPYLVTKDEVDVNNLKIQTRVNGELRQDASTSDLIFNCSYLVSYLSKLMTLKPGDIIFTGTPSGVILGQEKTQQEWLKPKDVVEIEIEGIGCLENTFG